MTHQERGQTRPKYMCVDFLKRAPAIMQLREGPLRNRLDKRVCQEDGLQINDWLIIDAINVDHAPSVPCTLQGGYNIAIYDNKQRRGYCQGYKGHTRLESECTTGEGMVFYFRSVIKIQKASQIPDIFRPIKNKF